VLDVPNKYGKAVVWYSKSWRSTVTGQEGGFYIRCFLPASFTEELETTRSLLVFPGPHPVLKYEPLPPNIR
jgi:hypothetical protein